MVKAVGLIVGHGFTKAYAAAGTAVFPSVAAMATASDFETTLGAGMKSVDLKDDGRWIVGNDAVTFAPNRIVTILDRSRYASPSFIALARAALAAVVPDRSDALSVFTGIPSAWFSDKAAVAALVKAVEAAAAPWYSCEVKVAPESAGVFYAHAFAGKDTPVQSQMEGDVGVIDIGYRDANVALFSNGRFVSGDSIPGGMVETMREVKRIIAASFQLELSLHEVDEAVRTGVVRKDGVTAVLPSEVKAVLARNLVPVISAGRSAWANGGRTFRAIVVGGGGGSVFFDAIKAEYPQAVLMDAPQLAGAKGFYAMANAALMRKRG